MLHCGSTATLGRLTAPHWEGHATPSPSLRWIVLRLYPETVSLRRSGECLWGFGSIFNTILAVSSPPLRKGSPTARRKDERKEKKWRGDAALSK